MKLIILIIIWSLFSGPSPHMRYAPFSAPLVSMCICQSPKFRINFIVEWYIKFGIITILTTWMHSNANIVMPKDSLSSGWWCWESRCFVCLLHTESLMNLSLYFERISLGHPFLTHFSFPFALSPLFFCLFAVTLSGVNGPWRQTSRFLSIFSK